MKSEGMNKDELKSILEQHWLWVGGNGGKRANLRGANLRGANLSGANLGGANLRGADLRGADLQGADLLGADLLGADLRGANLSGANLGGANLRGANLQYADLQYADLQYADLQGANLPCANLRSANLRGANLSGANLGGANLRGADLRGADLRGADLLGADLRGANLQGADLQGANLRGADLLGADLRGANLDYSFLPLWCGSKGMIVDRRIAAQIAAHFCALVCDDEDYQAARTAILEFAKTSHRAMDLGLLEEIVKECNDVATPIDVALRKRIAELEEEQVILKDQQREAKNILIDKNLHIDSLYEEGYKLQQRIAELERDFDMLFRSSANKQPRKNTQTDTIVYGKEREE